MLVRELNHGKCKTYLVACERTRRAALIDPLRDRLERYLALLAYLGFELHYAIDTHTHADHRTALFELRELVGAKAAMHREAPAPHVDVHLEDGQTLELGEVKLRVLHTPGHTPDGICLYGEGRVFTGDTLLIRGTGRADFAGGDAGAQYDAIPRKLFALPDETIVLPAHDYRGHTQSTIGEERRLNPRLAGKRRQQYVEIMANLGLPLPDKIQEVLQPNQAALEDDAIAYPNIAQLNQVRQLEPRAVAALRGAAEPPLVLDVREPEEYRGELGHVPGAILLPLKELAARAGEIEAWRQKHVVAICRAGVRSTTAAAILTSLGFEQVSNLKGGMLAWNDAGLTVER
ncbi:MAG: MBL fold metallo-hydrolase [Rhodocyclales bacterium]|nr:MBL fold metallo-hydrolase [Rhodocyclales bacterium]